MKFIIVGAGLGGLSAAVCFARRGHEVLILERNPALTPRGGAINIRPGASRIMREWDLEADLTKISEQTPNFLLRRMDTGDISMGSAAVDISSFPDWGTFRQDVVQLLFRKALDKGVRINFCSTVSKVSEDAEGASVSLDNGALEEADVVVVADGIRSRLRSKILPGGPEATDPAISRVTFYGFQVPADDLRSHPGTSRLMDQVSGNCWLGKGAFVITRFNSRLQRVGFLFGVESETDQKSLWEEHGDINYVRERFAGSTCSELDVALSLATECDRWKLAEMPDLPRWSSDGGRILLLGDSAHGMHPNAAQGYSQIVEDIAVLDFLISHHSEKNKGLPLGHAQMQSVSQAWQAIRKPRVERIKAYSRWNTDLFLGKGAPMPGSQSAQHSLKSIKNAQPDINANFQSSRFLKWALDHDAVDEAKRFVKELEPKL
ncbi:unnamed protein product [Clonostachys chloroleuca]|uniref:FAD-binding domain-containing protein n=1 Tax=Clonostachys chloroleuca TaxID=1926264 RepID=A0AA35MDX0_9HYPO|nr:unnamed protein product [Clonostachys chloroleuca]